MDILRRRRIAAAAAAALAGAPGYARSADACALHLRLIGHHALPAQTQVDGELFGGISGLDYDPRDGHWYMVSDDRAEHGPSRFFVAALDFDSSGVSRVALQRAVRLHAVAEEVLDAESLRIDPAGSGDLLIASEGDPRTAGGPWIRRASRDGRWLSSVPLPENLASTDATGPRPNRSIEGLAFTAGATALWVSLEAPMRQDGPPADPQRGADIRLTRLSAHPAIATQYAYPVDPARPHADGKYSDNGVSEILALTQRQLLVLERSGVQDSGGGFRFHSRLYCADTQQATDVVAFGSLAGRRYDKAAKRLVIDFDTLPQLDAGNLEAMSWGPVLANGHRSLVLASDNNFFAGVPTQLLFFEVLP